MSRLAFCAAVFASACTSSGPDQGNVALAGGFTVQLQPFAATATNDYLLELTPVEDYTGTLSPDAVVHTFSITDPMCGNGVIDAGEQCDDGAANGTAGDACSSTCTCVPS